MYFVWDNKASRYKRYYRDELDKWTMADDTVEEYFWKSIESDYPVNIIEDCVKQSPYFQNFKDLSIAYKSELYFYDLYQLVKLCPMSLAYSNIKYNWLMPGMLQAQKYLAAEVTLARQQRCKEDQNLLNEKKKKIN